ncbi:FecR family protein [Chitinophaga sp. G-6-1-13]|uniref:FecR family protein n=1 Tax=Chitinophaga fulva TaxID=2728842 RepID=A0A848GKF0_9BACT|nr:FecR family protein [Chitinophaga fulva]NML37879.1 FecR family protein [Chitinophaga fulva]
MENTALKSLLHSYQYDLPMTGDDIKQLRQLLMDPENAAQVDTWLMEQFMATHKEYISEDADTTALFNELRPRLGLAPVAAVNKKSRVFRLPGWTRAAAAILVIMTLSFLWRKLSHTPVKSPITAAPSEVLPPTEGAILTLGDGSTIALDHLRDSTIKDRDGNTLHAEKGQLVYNAGNARPETTLFNTLTTPRGRLYHLILEDGSAVWLNTASSLRYPSRFGSASREVTLSGEAYFEIAPDAHKPFRVVLDKHISVQVLGTRFNIKAYGEEAGIQTTLLDGAVNVTSGQQQLRLAPGQQAQVNTTNGAIHFVPGADTEHAMAWKNGIFRFEKASMHSVMQELSRWYDVNIIYEKGAPLHKTFSGELQRDLNLSQVLKGLSTMGIHYRIENNSTVVILP